MVLKSFKIDIDGEEKSVSYEDDLTFGELESILNKCVNISDLGNPQINIPQYRMDILIKVLREAPFKTGDAVTIRNLSAKTVKQIMSEVMRDYPLAKYLEDWMESFTGLAGETKSSTTSTTYVPPNLGGINKQ
jgi:hypothetical protein